MSGELESRSTEPAPLEQLASQTKRALSPVAPSERFRARLREGLRMAASHREAQALLVRQRAETPWGLLASAAALGSAAGLVAILLRVRRSAPTTEEKVADKHSE